MYHIEVALQQGIPQVNEREEHLITGDLVLGCRVTSLDFPESTYHSYIWSQLMARETEDSYPTYPLSVIIPFLKDGEWESEMLKRLANEADDWWIAIHETWKVY